MPILNPNGRRTLYTPRGLRRMVCVRCRRFNAVEQWHLSPCILGNPDVWMPICLNCDVELNALVLRFWKVADARRLLRDYRARLIAEHGQPRRVA